ncbi:MAG: hypothetical protein JW768_12720 [Chitinispirillaceae bacterium]|nr:hypothetical protein [Chitinispirillaceae bacterium]
MLPILSYRAQITAQLEKHGSLVVTAPPGTGKSTQIPQFFLPDGTPQRRIIVLEPRRIATRSLACRVARELGEPVGATVGYQIRFERRVSDATRILFTTYGTFLQLLMDGPEAAGCALVLFDEFHERTLEADAALAWVRYLKRTIRADLRCAVLSATIEAPPLGEFLGRCGIITVEDQSYPVTVQYQAPWPAERVADQVLRAFSSLVALGHRGSVLVFLPGVFEIERAAENLFDACKRHQYRILMLHGRMAADRQQEALTAPSQEQCVILSTNVAETSLTIPGVNAVIDSGFARMAAYDPVRDRNTLYLSRISMQNAEQRAGRAGRLGPGTCIRLWSHDDETAMASAIIPEILRLDLARIVLTLGAYATTLISKGIAAQFDLRWLTAPPRERWEKAIRDLETCEAVQCNVPRTMDGFPKGTTTIVPLTPGGMRLSSLPLDPRIGKVLLETRKGAEQEIAIAMAALWESGNIVTGESHDLFALACDFLSGATGSAFSGEVPETFDQIARILGRQPERKRKNASAVRDNTRESVSRTWMRVFSHRIAGRSGQGLVYDCADGRSARLAAQKTAGNSEKTPPCILALSIHEQAGRGQAKRAVVPLFLPLDTGWILADFPHRFRTEVECTWDDGKKRVNLERVMRFDGIICGREEVNNPAPFREEIAACLARQMCKGGWDWQSREPKAVQWLFRMKLVAAHYPKEKIPAMNDDDWELVFHDLCLGKRSRDDVMSASMLHALKAYVGGHLAGLIERKAPDTVILPSGKKGRITYCENAPPELSARLGDLIGHPARFTLMNGRVPGVFVILAPNFRTVQKTADLGAFWKTAYPRIKQELKRRYPKHPWP